MSKRSAACASPAPSEGTNSNSDEASSSDDIAAKKMRLVTFEPVRLLAVSGVNDIEDRKAKVQVYKLSELVRSKNKQLAEKDRELERLRQRQITDENTSFTINRHWNNLDEQLRTLAMRGNTLPEAEGRIKVEEEQEQMETETEANDYKDFLIDIVQMDDEQSKNVYDKRVQQSINLMKRVMRQHARRAEKQRDFIKKLKVANSEASTSQIREDVNRELVLKTEQLTEENAMLHQEVAALQQCLSETNLRLHEEEDRNYTLTTRKEELENELNDLKFDLEKAQRLTNKLDYKIYCMSKEDGNKDHVHEHGNAAAKTNKQNGQINGGGPSGNSNKQMDDLKQELAEKTELANSRLAEIKENRDKIQKMAEEMDRIKIEKMISGDAIRKSEEYENLMAYYSLAIEECSRLKENWESVLAERDLLRQELIEKVEEMKKEEQISIRKAQAASDKMNKDNTQLRTEYDMLRMEFEQSISTQSTAMQASEGRMQEIKTLLNSIRTQNYNLKQDANRFKKKWKDAVNLLAKTQAELQEEKKRLENAILVELNSDELASPDSSREDLRADWQSEEVEKLRLQVAELQAAAEAANGTATDRNELLIREQKMRLENEALMRYVKRVGAMDKQERTKFFEEEAHRICQNHKQEIDRLTTECEALKVTEKAISDEVDNIGVALEQLQEQNSILLNQKKEKDDDILKMMSDRITSSQIQIKMREEIIQNETQIENLTRQASSLQSELQAVTESLKVSKESIVAKTKENNKLTRLLETQRKQMTEKGFEIADLSSRFEKLQQNNKELQNMVMSKTGQIENAAAKRKRMEEEMLQLRKKLERAQKSEKLGSTDAVLNEEIRLLKDALTCSACKVNKKDAILTKCRHIFCQACLQKRYDTRFVQCELTAFTDDLKTWIAEEMSKMQFGFWRPGYSTSLHPLNLNSFSPPSSSCALPIYSSACLSESVTVAVSHQACRTIRLVVITRLLALLIVLDVFFLPHARTARSHERTTTCCCLRMQIRVIISQLGEDFTHFLWDWLGGRRGENENGTALSEEGIGREAVRYVHLQRDLDAFGGMLFIREDPDCDGRQLQPCDLSSLRLLRFLCIFQCNHRPIHHSKNRPTPVVTHISNVGSGSDVGAVLVGNDSVQIGRPKVVAHLDGMVTGHVSENCVWRVCCRKLFGEMGPLMETVCTDRVRVAPEEHEEVLGCSHPLIHLLLRLQLNQPMALDFIHSFTASTYHEVFCGQSPDKSDLFVCLFGCKECEWNGGVTRQGTETVLGKLDRANEWVERYSSRAISIVPSLLSFNFLAISYTAAPCFESSTARSYRSDFCRRTMSECTARSGGSQGSFPEERGLCPLLPTCQTLPLQPCVGNAHYGSIVEDDKIDRCAGMGRRGRNGAALGIVNEGTRNRPWPADRQADEKTGREKEKVRKKEESWTIQNIRNMQRYGNML
ncbi:hypothetical protein WR25_22056 [Diploscapter pachys]|uniref:RING-type E3 ubiquitin transferase n=1 Tax=Diploscapter pachys TaxID=2018661 RepID=A0A2A2LEE6_9BILA|nr:hypothetical protein WR25_22056 [Diploscapter pachys]